MMMTPEEHQRDAMLLHDLRQENPKLRKRIEALEMESTKRGARMQMMREWMVDSKWRDNPWHEFLRDYPEADDWFDGGGVPVREE